MKITPTITRPRVKHGVAGQIIAWTKVTYPGEPASVVRFYGSTFGSPGPVVMVSGNPALQTYVDAPGRFGESLDAEWVRRFFG